MDTGVGKKLWVLGLATTVTRAMDTGVGKKLWVLGLATTVIRAMATLLRPWEQFDSAVWDSPSHW